MNPELNTPRCEWALADPLLQDYHDREYGFPVTSDREIFERLMLEMYQAGLSWLLILRRRAAFNEAFHSYNPQKVAAMTDAQLDDLMTNAGIIRNRRKLEATVHNARTAVGIIGEYGSLHSYFSRLPYQVAERSEFAVCVKRMKADGFKFIGNLVLEEFFNSTGFNQVTHQEHCFLHPDNR